ncbi:MAG: disulfide bond formation protein B [Alphaproteobacteria bacterium]
MEFFRGMTPRTACFAILAITTATLAGAWGFELIGKFLPCPLCLEQRLPYYATLPLAAGGYLLARNHRSGIASIILGVLVAGFLANAALGAYHSGAEWKWWPGPDTCAGGGIETSAANLLATLDQVITPRCDEAALRIFGLSLAGYNVIISLSLAAIAGLGIASHLRCRKTAQN